MDAWVGFLEHAANRPTRGTRPDVRPFSVDEQERILTVGACLTCHQGDSPTMRAAVVDFRAVLRRARARCAVPVWD